MIRQIEIQGNYAVVTLAKGQKTFIDVCDLDLVKSWNWFATNGRATIYAARSDYTSGKKKWVMMHRVILDCPENMFVDHINGDGLDNRKSNLRIVTHAENSFNRKRYITNTSGHKGVSWLRNSQKWIARISYRNTRKNLGLFNCITAAKIAYEKASIEIHGEFRRR
jgi:hypothetical protein